MNAVSIAGNLTRDPELRYTTSGKSVCSLNLAVNRRYQVNNEWQEDVSFFTAVVWGERGEHAAASFAKGNRVSVCGRLDQRSYETTEGDKRSVVEIIASEVAASVTYATCEITRVVRDQPAAEFPVPVAV
jgi:single-strand DNA-binding protein